MRNVRSVGEWVGCWAAGLIAMVLAPAAGAMTLDFTLLGNGQKVQGQDVGFGVIASSPSGALGAAIFDTGAPTNCAAGAPDEDLCVTGQGPILIVQDPVDSAESIPGTFDVPNDKANFILDLMWPMPVTLEKLTLIDWNGGTATSTITLTDAMMNTAVWTFPVQDWTGEIPGTDGKGVFDLQNFAAQSDEGGPASSAAVVDAGFDGTTVTKLSIFNPSSGGIDDIVFTPEPSTALLLAGGLLGLLRVGRRRGR